MFFHKGTYFITIKNTCLQLPHSTRIRSGNNARSNYPNCDFVDWLFLPGKRRVPGNTLIWIKWCEWLTELPGKPQKSDVELKGICEHLECFEQWDMTALGYLGERGARKIFGVCEETKLSFSHLSLLKLLPTQKKTSTSCFLLCLKWLIHVYLAW